MLKKVVFLTRNHCDVELNIIIIIVGFIQRKIDTNPLMRLSPRRESPGTGMGRHLKIPHQSITKVGGMPA